MKKKQIARYQCRFCGKRFVREANFLAHKCKEMIREEELRTPIGQAAWLYYKEWLKQQRKLVHSADTFLHSKFYQSFIRFAKFAKSVQMPDVHAFIRLMIQKDIPPTLWTMDQMYTEYIEFLDRRESPYKRAQTTVDMLYKIADAAEVDVSEVFDVLEPSELIVLLRQRRLSPWILLCSKKFHKFLIERVQQSDRVVIESIIRPKFWAERINNPKNKEVVEQMKQIASEMGI